MKLKERIHRFLHDEKLKRKLYVIIFESDTPAGKLFDVILIACIVFRVFKLFNFLNEGERLLTALRESSKKIAVFFLFVVILVTSIGTLMYMIEGTQPNSQFNNIPNSIYWAIVTMTTVGYGDITPATDLGKFLSACVMLIGYTIIAVPTGIVSASMMKEYKRRRDKECPNCHRSGHEDNAEFCKYCGHSLNPSETKAEEK